MGDILKRKNKKGVVTYQARVRKHGSKPKYATFSRASDAKAWIEEETRNIRLGIHLELPEAKKHTLAEAIDRYQQGNPSDRYTAHRLKCWRESLGPLFLANIDEIKINDICATWKNTGWQPGYKLAPATLNRQLP